MKIEHPLLVQGDRSDRRRLRAAGWGARSRITSGTRTRRSRPRSPRTTASAYIYAFFHEVMLFPAYYWNWPEMHILISEHRDGELITQVIKRLGFSVVRGSTTRGGARALREMSLRIDRGHLCVTPDGPRGPRRSVHQGIAYLGSRTGFPIVGAGMAFKKPWRAKSWDRFRRAAPVQPGRLRGAGGRDRAGRRRSRYHRGMPPRGRAADAGSDARSRGVGRGALSGRTAWTHDGICSRLRTDSNQRLVLNLTRLA